jgi:two-component system response regulator QseB
MRILLVEDDAMIGAAVEKGLRADGHAVDWSRDGKAAETALAAEPYELVLLDLGLPRKDGLAVLKTLRAGGNRVPVIVVTARDAIADRVAGLDAGADDYLVKPFDLDELAARMRAVTRRREGRAAPAITHGALTLDPVLHAVTLHGKPVELSAREFTLLVALLERPGAVLSRAQLEERLYGWNDEIASNAVEVHIHNLRRKLGAEAIENVRGAGYRVGKLD